MALLLVCCVLWGCVAHQLVVPDSDCTLGRVADLTLSATMLLTPWKNATQMPALSRRLTLNSIASGSQKISTAAHNKALSPQLSDKRSQETSVERALGCLTLLAWPGSAADDGRPLVHAVNLVPWRLG